MKRLCYLGILKESFSAYLSPVMLIGRKEMHDKKSSDRLQAFEHHNCQNNLSYPLIKDTFVTLGNSKCDVLLLLI